LIEDFNIGQVLNNVEFGVHISEIIWAEIEGRMAKSSED